MLLSNSLCLHDRQAAVTGFRTIAREYGLDLQRVTLMGRVDSAWDDGCLLVAKPDKFSVRPPLFTKTGDPTAEILQECSGQKSSESSV